MSKNTRKFIFENIRTMIEQIDRQDDISSLFNAQLDGFITALYFSNQIDKRTYHRLNVIRWKHYYNK